MADTQRAKARSMMSACGYKTGGKVKKMAMGGPMMANPSAMAAPQMLPPRMALQNINQAPAYKKGGKVVGYAKGGKVKRGIPRATPKAMSAPPMPAQMVPQDMSAMASPAMKKGGKVKKFAIGGASKIEHGVATPAGAPKKPSIPSAKSKMTLPKTRGR